MEKFFKLLDVWGLRISTLLIIIVFFKTCGTNGKINRVENKIIENKESEMTINKKIDSLALKLRKEIQIEGLKSEKRMIQSTDRKILDVNRQTEIDKEISTLEK
jgi:hypothetical protein